MINIIKYSIVTVLVLFPLLSFAQPDDLILGKVNLRNGLKVDNQAKKEISAIAAKIKKIRKPGAVKIRGDYPSALNEDEYLEKSVFMAHEVEQHLKKLLPSKQQIYVLTSKFQGGKSNGQNQVELFFYPNELIQGDIKTFRSSDIQATDLQPKESATAEEASSSEQFERVLPAEQPVQPVVREPVRSGGDGKSSTVIDTGVKKPVTPEEDSDLANELVNKAKARAAERAKRRNSAE